MIICARASGGCSRKLGADYYAVDRYPQYIHFLTAKPKGENQLEGKLWTLSAPDEAEDNKDTDTRFRCGAHSAALYMVAVAPVVKACPCCMFLSPRARHHTW